MNAVLQRERPHHSVREPATLLPAMTPSDCLRRHRTDGSGFEKVNFMGCEIIPFPLPVPSSGDIRTEAATGADSHGSSVLETLKRNRFPCGASKITAACGGAIRACRREHPDLSMEEFLQVLNDHMKELDFDAETADSYLSSAIAHFDDARDASPFEAALDALRENDARVNLADDLSCLPDSLYSQYQELATLIFFLERFSGKTAFLGCVEAGRFLGVTKVTANKHLKAMAKLGIINITREWMRGQAREFTLGQMASVPPELEVYTRHKKQEPENKKHEARRKIQKPPEGGGRELSEGELQCTQPVPMGLQHQSVPRSPGPSDGESVTVECDGCKKDFGTTEVVENPNNAQLCPGCQEKWNCLGLKPEERTRRELLRL
jgi:hypothetical protein